MSYNHKTAWYGIPIIGVTQRVQSSEEQKGAQIIENQIRGILRIFGDGIITEGTWAIDEKEGKIRASLRPKAGVALEAVLRETYVRRKNPLTWSTDIRGKVLYLSVVPGEDLPQHPDRVQLVVSEDPKESKVSLLLATVDDTRAEPRLDSHPLGKKFVLGG